MSVEEDPTARWKPSIGPKLEELYREQQVREGYTARHLKDYQRFASLQPLQGLHKGRHHKDLHEDHECACTSCHFCRQRTEDLKPCCSSCGKHFCAPCLGNRFGQDAHKMRQLDTWQCPQCLDICNCSGTNCRRSLRGLLPTASLIHEAQAHGYSSVRPA